eukprot:6473590-Amphidinium_carterae.1
MCIVPVNREGHGLKVLAEDHFQELFQICLALLCVFYVACLQLEASSWCQLGRCVARVCSTTHNKKGTCNIQQLQQQAYGQTRFGRSILAVPVVEKAKSLEQYYPAMYFVDKEFDKVPSHLLLMLELLHPFCMRFKSGLASSMYGSETK